jgi:hypothetical protein
MQTAFFMRLRFIYILIAVLSAASLNARQPDSLQVASLYNTSWQLSSTKKPAGVFHRLKKVPQITSQRITIYKDEFHISSQNAPYQICTYRLRNCNEFWLDGSSLNQMIYRVIRTDNKVLILDVIFREKNGYRRSSRNTYTRVLN